MHLIDFFDAELPYSTCYKVFALPLGPLVLLWNFVFYQLSRDTYHASNGLGETKRDAISLSGSSTDHSRSFLLESLN